uniref:Vacuolar protein sorting-associated protein 28 homolog n=1 Tax=Globodera rostochiensis TaxID=31243 RepID=A0A914I379_GLORO
MAAIDLSQEVRLYDNNAERDRIDNMAELRDYIHAKEYTAECSKLLVQIKVALRLVSGVTIEEFARTYHIQCPAALERIREDRPITLKLNIRAVDELFPNLNDLYASINAMSTLPDDFDAKLKVKAWHDKLHGMAAHEEISDEVARQMIFELETAYNAFQRFLRST